MRMSLLVLLASWMGVLLVPNVSGAARWRAGVVGGLNLASFDPGYSDMEPRFGLAAGLQAGVEWRHAALTAAILYSEKGARIGLSEAAVSPNDQVEWRLRDLDLPVLLMVPFPRAPGWVPQTGHPGPYIVAGPLLTIRLNGDYRYGPVEKDLSDLKGLGLAMTAGLGVELPPGDRAARLELRYSRGITNVSNADDLKAVRDSVWSLLVSLQR